MSLLDALPTAVSGHTSPRRVNPPIGQSCANSRTGAGLGSYRAPMRQTTRVMSVLATLVAGAVLGVASPATATATTATATALASSANPSTVGQAVTLTATVTGDAPSGTVTFSEPGITLGTSQVSAGAATLMVSSWTAGVHTITASYSGDLNNDPSTAALTQTVSAPVKKPKVRLSVSTAKASVGDKVKLKWRTKHADSVMASGDWRGSRPAKGSKRIRLSERGKYVFKLTVKNDSGKKTAKVVVLASRKAKELELVVTDEPVLVGDDVKVTADGLAKGETYTVRLDGKPVLTGKADKRGDVDRTFEVAKTTKEGALALTITGSNPGRVGEAVLNVVRPKTLELELAHAEMLPRDLQTVTVTGLLPGESVTVFYLGEQLITDKADDSGAFEYTFTVTKPFGKQTVKVEGMVPARFGVATFTALDPGRDPNNGG